MQKHTEVHILVLIPERKVFFDGLMSMEGGHMTFGRCYVIRSRENPFTGLEIFETYISDIERVPKELTPLVMGMPMKGRYKEAQA